MIKLKIHKAKLMEERNMSSAVAEEVIKELQAAFKRTGNFTNELLNQTVCTCKVRAKRFKVGYLEVVNHRVTIGQSVAKIYSYADLGENFPSLLGVNDEDMVFAMKVGGLMLFNTEVGYRLLARIE